jgi:putative membrane protein
MRFLLRLVINTVALWAAIRLVPGLRFDGSVLELVGAALVFGLVNASIGVVIRILALPVTFLTLGLFSLVINGLLLWITARVSQALGLGLHVDGLWAAIVAAVVVSIVSMVLWFAVSVERKL